MRWRRLLEKSGDAEELARHYKTAAKKSSVRGKLHAGAVTFVQ